MRQYSSPEKQNYITIQIEPKTKIVSPADHIHSVQNTKDVLEMWKAELVVDSPQKHWPKEGQSMT